MSDWAEMTARASAQAEGLCDHASTRAIQRVASLLRAAYQRGRDEMTFETRSASAWRTIDSAPKDGTRVLVYARMPAYNQWTDPDHTVHPMQSTASWHPDAGWCVCEVREVTHWQPLPEPPAE